MRSDTIRGAAAVAAITALSAAVAGCSGDDADAEAAARAGDGRATMPTAVGDDGTTYWGMFPVFPGAGTDEEAAEPLPDGMVCDSVPGADELIPDPIRQCFFGKDDVLRLHPAATVEQVLECAEHGDAVHLRLTFHPSFVDNTYGATAIGWSEEEAGTGPADDARKKKRRAKGHSFKDLVGSDHAEIIVKDGAGRIVLQFKLDYVSEDPSAASGYASLGVTGGEGKVIVGDASDVVSWMTSIDRNLNQRGYGSYTVDSPATDDRYTPNTATPEWDYRVVYEAWIDADAFGPDGFGGAFIEYVHASPAKGASNTIEVEPGDCPPPPCKDRDPDGDCGPGDTPPPGCVDNDPDTFCGEAGSGAGGRSGAGGSGGASGNGGDDPCADADPDTVCGEAGRGAGGDPQYCDDHPEDPACRLD
jgi:hypothetical protein